MEPGTEHLLVLESIFSTHGYVYAKIYGKVMRVVFR